MQFSAHEFSLDQRSGLNLTPDRNLPIKEKLDLQFYVQFDKEHTSYFGYIFRLIVGDRNIDLIHGVVPENPNNFELILGDEPSKIAFHIPVEELTRDWIKFRFEIDFRNNQVTAYIRDTLLADEFKDFDKKAGFRLMFGAHNYANFSSTDVPAMILRDVEVIDGNDHFLWPLNETEGTVAHSVPKGNNGLAINPGWLLKRHNTWSSILNRGFSGGVKTTFDSQNGDLYILSSDSVHVFNANDQSMKRFAQDKPFNIGSPCNIIFNNVSNSLVKYSLDNNYVSTFDFNTGQWTSFNRGTVELTNYLHHNRFIKADGSILTFGGYGYHMYKNSLMSWNRETKQFEQIPYKGVFHPRYLAGGGFNPVDGKYYIIGGYGSESGKQSVNPHYYYEIQSFSMEDSTFSILDDFPKAQVGFCLANSVVFDDSSNVYALHFPKNEFNNKLQLVKIPLQNPELIELGDPIDYSFLDVKSFADLYYSKGNNSLVAVSTYTSEDQSTVSVHSIAFPPQPFIMEATSVKKGTPGPSLAILVAIAAMALAILLFFPKKRIAKADRLPNAVPREPMQKSRKNSIILFGGFQVIDREGNDITAQFTPLPKKIFLFILLHSLRNNKGVSSNTMYETFWFDKSVESARNNRAVNIVKLKSLLEKLDNASISKETGYWKFDFDPAMIYIDYFEYLQIVNQETELTREDMVSLLSIIEKKPFLNNTNAEWLDPFKSDLSNEIIDTIINYIGKSDEDPEFLMNLVNCIFVFDPVSEEALRVKCKLLIRQGKHSLAKKAYSSFIAEYKILYDEEYGTSFNQVIEEQ